MSVLIKDMEMPKKCGECDIYVCYRTWNGDPGDEFCGMTKENVSYKTKPDWCPLAEVPERKPGKWITSDDMYETGICPCCKWDSQEPVSYTITNFDFCPNSGADMRGEQDD